MAQRLKGGKPAEPIVMEPFTVEFEFDDADDAEHVLQGLIVARSNNSNELFVDFIDAINENLAEFRAAKLRAEVAARG